MIYWTRCRCLFQKWGGGLEIIDGQHRVEIAKMLGRPVHYIIRKPLSLHNMAKINSNVEKWKSKDFIRCYIKAGNKNYEKIEDFMDQYGTPLSVSLILLHDGVVKTDGSVQRLRDQFEKGEFVVKHYKQAIDVVECCQRFEAHKGWNKGSFIAAISRILQADKCNIDDLVEKFLKDPKKLDEHGNYKSYLTNLENIYNTGCQKRYVIF